MFNSSSIGGLSRATGDEQVMKSQRIGDKKGKQNNEQRHKDKGESDDESQKQEFKAVIVEVDSLSNKQTVVTSEPTRAEQAVESSAEPDMLQKDKHETDGETTEAENNSNQSHPKGHIDVTG